MRRTQPSTKKTEISPMSNCYNGYMVNNNNMFTLWIGRRQGFGLGLSSMKTGTHYVYCPKSILHNSGWPPDPQISTFLGSAKIWVQMKKQTIHGIIFLSSLLSLSLILCIKGTVPWFYINLIDPCPIAPSLLLIRLSVTRIRDTIKSTVAATGI